jgi:tetratricopeptide (TPR) repeat protein
MSEPEPSLFGLRSQQPALTVLCRLAERQPHTEEWLARALTGRLNQLAETAFEVTAETGGPISRVLAELVSERARPKLAERLMRRCNERDFRESVPLLEVAEAATRRHLVCLYSSLSLRPDAGQLFELALTLGNLGSRRARLGHLPEALRYHQEALETWKSLVATHGIDEVLLNHAISLSNIGQIHGVLRDWQEALAPTEESVRQLRQLVLSGNETALPHLAVGLRNLGIIQSELKRPKEALATNLEGLKIQRSLTAKDPLAHRPELARDLTNSAGRLLELGRRDEALPLMKEALEIRREQAAERPEIFLPQLALSLHNLGVLLHELGRDDESLSATQKAVELRRQLAVANPEAFLELLARSLYNLSNRLLERDCLDEALDITGEVIGCYQSLLDLSPQRFLPDLADRLTHYNNILERLGRMEDRFESAEAGLRLLLPYIGSHREALSGWLDLVLGDYFDSSAATGRPRDPELTRQVFAARAGGGTR